MARRTTKIPLATAEGPPTPATNGGIGKPLAVLTESNGSREYFEAVGTFMEDHLQSTPFFTSKYAELTGETETFDEIIASAIARSGKGPEFHKRIRTFVASEKFRRQLARDYLTLAVSFTIEKERIMGTAPWLAKLGISSRTDLATQEERAAALETSRAGVDRAIELLREAYIDYVIYVVTTGNVPNASSINAFDPEALPFINAPHVQATARAIWAAADRPESWQAGEHGPPYYYDQPTAISVFMQDGPTHNPQAMSAARAAILELDDNVLATFVICFGKWLMDTGGDAKHITKTRIHVSHILSYRGVAKHHKGGYRREHKEETRRHLMLLRSIWVKTPDVAPDVKGRPKPVILTSPLLEFEMESQPDLSGGEDPFAFRIAPGGWALPYLGQYRWIAHLLKPVMQYNPDKQRLPMRLGFYLFTQWRIRASRENYAQPWRVATMLEGAIIRLPTTNFARFRDQFERALDQLQDDAVIAGWEYERNGELPDRAWFDLWLNWTVKITPPTFTVEQYRQIPEQRKRLVTRTKRAANAAAQSKKKPAPPQ